MYALGETDVFLEIYATPNDPTPKFKELAIGCD